jgi:hypothetical protein
MNQTEETLDAYFFQLVVSLQAGAMAQMGKVASPLTGKVERDLDMAKSSIDMLGMIKAKTEGNLSEEEQKLLDHVLYELRLNYVEELKKGDSPPTEKRRMTPPHRRTGRLQTSHPPNLPSRMRAGPVESDHRRSAAGPTQVGRLGSSIRPSTPVGFGLSCGLISVY